MQSVREVKALPTHPHGIDSNSSTGYHLMHDTCTYIQTSIAAEATQSQVERSCCDTTYNQFLLL